MKRMGRSLCVFACLWTLVGVASQLRAQENRVTVAVSILPQKYFVEKIGGNLVDVFVMIAPGSSAESYEPKPQQMVALSKARAYFALGIPFETTWLKNIASANPSMPIFRTEAGIKKRAMESHRHSHKHDDHSKDASSAKASGVDDDHDEEMADPHIWVSPPLAMLQARNILSGLLKIDPEHRDVYEANYKSFIGELADLDNEIRNIFFGKGQDLQFMVFHPAWGYFADAYGLKQVPIEVEGKEPKPAELKALIEKAGKLGVKVIFVEPQFSTKSAQTIADAIGARLMTADDLSPDWANNLREVAKSIAAAATSG